MCRQKNPSFKTMLSSKPPSFEVRIKSLKWETGCGGGGGGGKINERRRVRTSESDTLTTLLPQYYYHTAQFLRRQIVGCGCCCFLPTRKRNKAARRKNAAKRQKGHKNGAKFLAAPQPFQSQLALSQGYGWAFRGVHKSHLSFSIFKK